ncbi:glycerate kinase type-2 family protein [Halosimplex amylolyticum]|uniref:glycerate kinase type-2 family protein n=1 Tax=Halosimplex amylolyticum TaxID=3396616 RepID=UPI003F57A07D
MRDRDGLARTAAHEVVLDCLEAGIEAARPERVLADALSLSGDQLRITGEVYDLRSYDEVLVLGGGKAAGQVAGALDDRLGDAVDGGIVVTDDPVDTERVEVVEGSHPVPDEAGAAGARRVRERATAAGERTLVFAVITGGGSALLPAPAGDLSLGDVRETTAALLEAGAAIDEINAVRKHLSALKGGRLAAAAAPATVVTLAFSDVVGDDPGVIASGPTAPDPTTFDDALAVLDRYDLGLPPEVRAHLQAGAAGDRAETPGPDADFSHVRYHLLADAWTALDAARAVADDAGYETAVLSSRIRGEAREQGLAHAAVAEEVAATGNPLEPPAVVLSGGETTVTVRGDGSGGPNQEFALRAALELPDDAVLGAVDTDGRDGGTGAAGALVDWETIGDAASAAAARDALADNAAEPFLADRGALVRTGRTGTNVNDLRVLLVE